MTAAMLNILPFVGIRLSTELLDELPRHSSHGHNDGVPEGMVCEFSGRRCSTPPHRVMRAAGLRSAASVRLAKIEDSRAIAACEDP